MEGISAAAEPQRYTAVAVGLHWMIAALVLFNIGTGYLLDSLELSWRFVAVGLHVSAGISVLLLTILRVVWRLAHRPPGRSANLSRWERYLARCVHLALYGATVVMPLSGWALISANPPRGSSGWTVQVSHLPPAVRDGLEKHGPLTFWNMIELPMIAPLASIGAEPEGLASQRAIHDDLVHWHEIGAALLIGLLALHITGALKHEWFDGEAELARMGIGRPRTTSPASASAGHAGSGEIASPSQERPRA